MSFLLQFELFATIYKAREENSAGRVMVISSVFSGFFLFECQLCQSGSDTQPAIVCASKDSLLGFL